MFQHFDTNTRGRDFVVPDLHGCFGVLNQALAAVAFNEATDRMFCTGDLVDRGPQSHEVLDWLDKPWFHSVRGNHEQMAMDAAKGDYDPVLCARNGGAWFLALTQPERIQYADAFARLPVALDIDTPNGLVGIVHAECPVSDWRDMAGAVADEQFAQRCMWTRDRHKRKDESCIDNVAMVVVGYTVVDAPMYLGNVLYLDCGAVFGRPLQVMEIHNAN